MKAIAGAHAAALESYVGWIDGLTRIIASGEAVQVGAIAADIVRRSAEFISAQQQLARTVELQAQNIQAMAADIRHIAAMARSLSGNKDAARQLREQHYERQIRILQEYGAGNRPAAD
jgi:negative regulator of replication initiation